MSTLYFAAQLALFGAMYAYLGGGTAAYLAAVATLALTHYIGRRIALRRHRRIRDTRFVVAGQCPECRSTVMEEVTSDIVQCAGCETAYTLGRDGLIDRVAARR